MIRFEEHLMKNPTDLVLVVGDVTSTMACAITARNPHKGYREAGIRSNDWSMPEEINRLVTDAITNYFFTTSDFANANLKASGYGDDQIFFLKLYDRYASCEQARIHSTIDLGRTWT